jgi:hypothetical protein
MRLGATAVFVQLIFIAPTDLLLLIFNYSTSLILKKKITWSGLKWSPYCVPMRLSKSHYDRQSVGQSVLVSGAHLGHATNFSFSLKFPFRHLRVCYFVAPSLTRGRVCNLLVQLLLGLARAVTLGSKSRRTHDHILLSNLRLPWPGGPGPRIYIPQEQGGLVTLFLALGLLYPEDGNDTFLRNVGSHKTHTVPHPRGRHSS